MATKTHLVIDQGTDFTFTFDLVDDNDQIIDLNDYTGTAIMRKHYTSSNGVSFNVSVSGNTGEITLSMNSAITANITPGRYVYDCELADSNDVYSRVLEGEVTITPRVRRP